MKKIDKKTKKIIVLFFFFMIICTIPIYFFISKDLLSSLGYSSGFSLILSFVFLYLSSAKGNKNFDFVNKLILVLLSISFLYSISVYMTTAYYLFDYLDVEIDQIATIILDFKSIFNFFDLSKIILLKNSLPLFFIMIFMIFIIYEQSKKHNFFGKEHGSSNFSGDKERKKFFLHLKKDIDNEFIKFMDFLNKRKLEIETSSLSDNETVLIKLKEKEEELKEHAKNLKLQLHKLKQAELDKEGKQNLKEIEKENAITKQNLKNIRITINDVTHKTAYDSIDLINQKIKLYSKVKSTGNNFILTNTESLPKDPNKIFRNNNQLVIGGSGVGKSRTYVKPNIAQCNSNFFVTDPKGELYRSTAKLLEQNGYIVSCLNLVDPQYSARYNMFKYIKSQDQIAKLVETIMQNTQGEGEKTDFWFKCEKAILSCVCYYCYSQSGQNTTLNDVYSLLKSINYPEPKPGVISRSILNDKLEVLKETDPNNPAHSFLAVFEQAPVKVRGNMLVSIGMRLTILINPEIMQLVSDDDFNLDDTECKRAVFVIMSDSNKAYNLIASLFFSQNFQLLYFLADFKYKGRLPLEYQFILDEFANIGQIYGFNEILATCRGRGIGISIIVQNIAQLEEMYKNNSKTIMSNCDTHLFLGSTDQSTCELISKMLGTTTYRRKDITYASKGKSVKWVVDKRLLMTPEEVRTMDNKYALLFIRGINPFRSEKYDITKHPLYDYLEDIKNFVNIYETCDEMRESHINKFVKLNS